jgi:SAM-dependent methyltransferase
MSKQYVIAGGEAGWRRLNLLARTMGPTTRAHLNDAGVREGMTCIDVGCGGGHVTRMLAEMVGPSGRVVGIDFDPVKLAAATAEAEGAGFRNIEFRAADVLQWREPSTYDVVYGRFILSHVPDSAGVLANMRTRCTRAASLCSRTSTSRADSVIRRTTDTGVTRSSTERWWNVAAATRIWASDCSSCAARPDSTTCAYESCISCTLATSPKRQWP